TERCCRPDKRKRHPADCFLPFLCFLPDGGSALSGLRGPNDVVGRISASAIRQIVSGLFYVFFRTAAPPYPAYADRAVL
ncbi:hypothetical protein, partial [Kosakonia cowanii]|uniref:hypothetical protein n=1 Tax=Kosakonia cowanii TaxID=208223 RepID=UPI002FDDD824